jgi:hypothetical protein
MEALNFYVYLAIHSVGWFPWRAARCARAEIGEPAKRTIDYACPDANSWNQHVDLAYGIPLLGLLAVTWSAVP